MVDKQIQISNHLDRNEVKDEVKDKMHDLFKFRVVYQPLFVR